MIAIKSDQNAFLIIDPTKPCDLRHRWAYYVWSPELFASRYVFFEVYEALDNPEFVSLLSAVQRDACTLKGKMHILVLNSENRRALIRCEKKEDAESLLCRISEVIICAASGNNPGITVIALGEYNAELLSDDEAGDITPYLTNRS